MPHKAKLRTLHPIARRRQKSNRQTPHLRILLTNGRFPVSLDLARQLYLAGFRVYVVDPMEYHVCKFSIAVWKSRQVPAPHVDPSGYVREVRKAVKEWNIDLVIPLHEEIFFLAEAVAEEEGDGAIGPAAEEETKNDDEKKEAKLQGKLLAPEWKLLIRLHNKWEYSLLMRDLGLDVPEAHLCKSMEDIRKLDLSKEWAVKPVYGRAATHVYHLKPGEAVPDNIDVSDTNHYVAQEWLYGTRYCSYSVVRNGRLQAHGVYPVKETIDGSSSVYFQQTEHAGIQQYVEKFAAAFPTCAAQLAFDFVELDNGRLVTMECNPRATSGIHLWSDSPFLARALTDTLKLTSTKTTPDFTAPPPTKLGRPPRRQVAPGMMMWERSKATPQQYVKHMGRLMSSKDVIFSFKDLLPTLIQPFLLTTYYEICRERGGMALPDMFQWDVTWEPDEEELRKVREMIERIHEEEAAKDGKLEERRERKDSGPEGKEEAESVKGPKVEGGLESAALAQA